MECLLCQNSTLLDHLGDSTVFKCSICDLIFKNPKLHLSDAEEKKRYESHQNAKADQGYINFLKRLLDPLEPLLPRVFSALDFGCGPGPVLSSLIKEKGAHVELYDPVFFPDNEVLKRQYEVVTCTEVVEHFKNPSCDWKILVQAICPNGLLAIMTQLVTADTVYAHWWYKNDPTHVVFYSEKTIEFLATHWNLKIIYNDQKSVVIFRKQ